MAKPMLGDDEEDALSMVMGGAPEPDGDEGAEMEAPAEGGEEETEQSDSGRILDEVQAKLEELRGLVASV